MVKTIVGFIDGMVPGHKTYILLGMGMLMMVCQSLGYHHFSNEAWGMIGSAVPTPTRAKTLLREHG